MTSAAFPYNKKRRNIHGREMAYVEVGQGDPIVLLHGNPTSSYLWRNVLPHLEPLGRCIAPDLIGMGDSEKLPDSGPNSYRFAEHRRYLGALLEALSVRERVTLVIHDWGSTLGFDWANHHRDAVKGIAYMEAMVGRQYWDHWDKFGMRPVLEALRSEAGEQMVLQDNFFVEKVLPGAILRKLSDEEMEQYRRPFAEPGEGRRPTLTFPRQIPIEGDPADVTAAVDAYAEWLKSSHVPKLFLRAEPGGTHQRLRDMKNAKRERSSMRLLRRDISCRKPRDHQSSWGSRRPLSIDGFRDCTSRPAKFLRNPSVTVAQSQIRLCD
ncbi:haloalkane dehalogenase [Bradyrhizobium sp. F1.13.1]